ncbi:hypothetical protein [Kibdelosporangium philippinense]
MSVLRYCWQAAHCEIGITGRGTAVAGCAGRLEATLEAASEFSLSENGP